MRVCGCLSALLLAEEAPDFIELDPAPDHGTVVQFGAAASDVRTKTQPG
jgi:hypothetical protein